MIFGIDAHPRYQDGLDMGRVADEGYAFALIKATQGNAGGYWAPSTFDGWIATARARGMVPGAYHWLTSASGSDQADRFLARVGDPDGLLCAVDVEETTTPPGWGTIEAFFRRFDQRTGGHPLILYTGTWWWNAAGRRWNGASLTPYLWHSRYVSGTGTGAALYARVPISWWTPGYGVWPRATILQYSSSVQVAGRRVDVDAFQGTMADLRALTGTATTSTTSGENMPSLIRYTDSSAVILTDGVTGRWVRSEEEITDLRVLAAEGTIQLGFGGGIRVVGRRELLGRIIGPCPEDLADLGDDVVQVTMTSEDSATIATDVVSHLAPYLDGVVQLADRLGAAGDVLGTLNDTPSD